MNLGSSGTWAPDSIGRAALETRSGRWQEHSRTVNEAIRTAIDEEVVQQTRDEPTAARPDEGPPDPIVVTKSEH